MSAVHAIALQFHAVIEGEDSDGDYDTTSVELEPKVVMDVLLERIGRTDSGHGFEATVEVNGEPTLVFFEWEAGWHVERRVDL